MVIEKKTALTVKTGIFPTHNADRSSCLIIKIERNRDFNLINQRRKFPKSKMQTLDVAIFCLFSNDFGESVESIIKWQTKNGKWEMGR